MERQNWVYFTLSISLPDTRNADIFNKLEQYAQEITGKEDDFVITSGDAPLGNILFAYGRSSQQTYERVFDTSLQYVNGKWSALEGHGSKIPSQFAGKILAAESHQIKQKKSIYCLTKRKSN